MRLLRALIVVVFALAAAPVSYAQQYIVNSVNTLNNLTATAAPTSSNDSSQGYSVGSLWQNTSNGTVYMAKSVAIGSAVWTALN